MRPRRAVSVIPSATGEAAAHIPQIAADQIGPVHRVVSADHEQPWWFRAREGREFEAGRFDLAGGRGTCYFADDELAALRERLLDPEAPDFRPPSSVLDGLRVWTVEPPPPTSAADTTDPDRGLPLEFGGGSDYEACWPWSDRLDADGEAAELPRR
jgi:hypothetical protein